MNRNSTVEYLDRLAGAWADWALASSWQLALLVVLVTLVALASRRLSARFRYLLWTLVLIKALMPPTLGMPWSIGNWAGPDLWQHSRATVSGHFDAPESPAVVFSSRPVVDMDRAAVEPPLLERAIDRPVNVTKTSAWSMRAVALAVWLAGFVVFTLFIAVRYWRLTHALKRAAVVDEGPMRVALERLAMRMGWGNPPELLLSGAVGSPFLFGLLRQRIVLPERLPETLEPGRLEDVLLHELTHWRRRDLAASWLQILVQSLFWFHPLVWLAGAQLRHERECACDEAVLASGCSQARRYGESLLSVLMAARGRSSAVLGFLGIFERNTRLQRRLEEIMNQENKVRRLSVGGWLALALFAALCLPMGAQPEKADQNSIQNNPPTMADEQAVSPAGAWMFTYTGPDATDRRSLGANGHAVAFEPPRDASMVYSFYIESVEIFAARYGTPEPPADQFHLFVLDEEARVLADIPFPYAMIERGEMKWYSLPTPSIEVPQKFMLGLAFNPHQTKGIYLGIDGNAATRNSLTGLPGEGYEKFQEGEWMVRLAMNSQPSGKRGVMRLADRKPPVENDPLDGLDCASYDNGPSDDKQSYGGRGPAIEFKLDDFDKLSRKDESGADIVNADLLLKGFRLYAGRYGSGYDPEEMMIKVAVLDSSDKLRWQGEFPYSCFNYKSGWVDLVLPQPVPVAGLMNDDGTIRIAFDPEAHRTKGIYFHYDKDPKTSHSFAGKVGGEFNRLSDRQWIIRACFAPAAETETRVYRTGPQWERPFVNDPDALGHWTAVDFVQDISQFSPDGKQWKGDLYVKEMDFLPGGKTKHSWQSWTHGWLWHSGDKAEGKYEIRNLDGRHYLFMEWISGDVTERGMKPAYYVFAKDVESTDPIVGRWRGAGSGDGSVMTFEPDQRWWSADDGGSSDQGRWYPGDGKYRFENSKGQVLPFDILVESDRLTLVSVTEPDEKFEMVRERAALNTPAVDEHKTSSGKWFLAGSQPQSYDLVCGDDDPQGAKGCALRSNDAPVQGFGTVMAEMPAESYRGKRVRMSAVVETRDVPIRAAMWMRVDGVDGKSLSFDNMGKRPIKGTVENQACEIVLDVPEVSDKIAYGLLLAGTGYARIGNVKFEAVGADVPVTIEMEKSSGLPRIVATSPEVGATGVDPATTEITVTFDRDMGGGMSWTGGGADFPPVPEGVRATWIDKRTCVRPVKLEAGRYYRIGINSTSYQNFASAEGVPARPSAIYFCTTGASPELEAKVIKPQIVAMDPPNGATDVDPGLTELRVTFSVPMGGGFFWTGGGPQYPEGREGERPHWSEDGRTCIRPVSLEPGMIYRVGLNSPSDKNFASRGGVPLDPVVYTFQTRH